MKAKALRIDMIPEPWRSDNALDMLGHFVTLFHRRTAGMPCEYLRDSMQALYIIVYILLLLHISFNSHHDVYL